MKTPTEFIYIVYCDDIYRPNFSLLNLSVNSDRNILTVYTEKITVKKKIKQYDNVQILQI